MADPTGRALTLLSLLQTHRHWSGAELAARLGVSERTVRRDVDRLRALGYPVEATPGLDGGYQLAAGAHLPPLVVDDGEAVALAIGLRAAAGAAIDGVEESSLRVMAKLEQILPDHVRRQVDALTSNLETRRWTPQSSVPPASLGVLARACRDREEVRFDYTRRDGETARRLVRPHQIVSIRQRWYLVAFDVRRDDWRTFRIDRMLDPSLAGARFDPLDLPTGSAVDFVEAGMRSVPFEHGADLLVTAPLDAAEALHRWFGPHVEVEPIDDEHQRLHLGSDDLEWLFAMIAIVATSFDVAVEQAPSSTMARLAETADRLSRTATALGQRVSTT